MTQPILTEEYIVKKTVEYLVIKENGNFSNLEIKQFADKIRGA